MGAGVISTEAAGLQPNTVTNSSNANSRQEVFFMRFTPSRMNLTFVEKPVRYSMKIIPFFVEKIHTDIASFL